MTQSTYKSFTKIGPSTNLGSLSAWMSPQGLNSGREVSELRGRAPSSGCSGPNRLGPSDNGSAADAQLEGVGKPV